MRYADMLHLVLHVLAQSWVAAVNGAEAEFWRRSSGVRVGWSDQILGFDCGGQQWVYEVGASQTMVCMSVL